MRFYKHKQKQYMKTKKMENKKTMPVSPILGAAVLALLAISFLGIQSAYARITTELDLGSRGTEVTELQTYLSTDVNIYPSGLVTGYFGQLTKAGVERFQTEEGIVTSGTPTTTGYGRVGPRTLNALNTKIAGGVTTSDVYAPVIKTVTVTTGNTNATVSWEASEASFGKVYYSTQPIRISNIFDVTGVYSGEPIVTGTLAQYDNNPRVSHTVNISGLASNTTYNYIVVVYDAAKNVSITSPSTFRTQ